MADLTSSKEDIENFKLKNLMNEFNQSNLSRIAPEVEMIGLGEAGDYERGLFPYLLLSKS